MSSTGPTDPSDSAIVSAKQSVTKPKVIQKKAEGPRSSNPLKELPPFQIQPESEFSNVDQWDATDYEDPQPSALKIVFFNTLFLARAIAPVALVAGLAFCCFYYYSDISQTVTKWHSGLVDAMRPEVVDPEIDEVLNDTSEQQIASSPTDERLSDEAASVAMKSNVQLSVEGVLGSGSGVVCDVVGQEALILTKLSLIDQDFWITQGRSPKNPTQLPNVELVYSDATKATGEVVWVAAGGVDLAIIRASAPAMGLQPVKRQATSEVSVGDVVFYVEAAGGFTERMAKTEVLEVKTSDVDNPGSVPVVQVDATDLPIGLGLFNRDGELVAISGGGDVLAGGKATAVHISALGDLHTPSLLDSEN